MTRAPAGDTAGVTRWVAVPDGRLKVRVYRSPARSAHPVLVLVLHGDSPFAPPSYQYAFAWRAAAALPDAVVAAVLRPGYADGTGERSGGVRGLTNGDNYTPRVVDDVAAVVAALRRAYRPAAVLLVGHSGGAALAADLLGREPGAADGALLVGCPCDLPRWRAHMYDVQRDTIWRLPVASLSPLALVPRVAPGARVRLVVGAEDSVAPAALSTAYARALTARGVPASVAVVPGLGHDILLAPVVLDQLRALATAIRPATAPGR